MRWATAGSAKSSHDTAQSGAEAGSGAWVRWAFKIGCGRQYLAGMRTLFPLLFVLGLVMKVLHLPFHTVFLLVVLAVWLVWSVVRMVRRQGKPASWAGLAIWAWCLHLVALLKLFPSERSPWPGPAAHLPCPGAADRRKPFWSPTLQKLAGSSSW